MSHSPAPAATTASTATQTIAPADAVELAVVERSGFVESRHLGAAILLDPDGAVVRSLGDVAAPIFPRSTIKPVQGAVAQSLGADARDEAAGLAIASHGGTPRHEAVVERMLTEVGLEVDDLQCPPAWPGDSHSRSRYAAAGGVPARVLMNCSGKHAAMLRACVAQGWPIATYLDPQHPLQVAIVEALELAAGERVAASGVDGCGAPVHAISLHGLARATRWAATASLTSPDPLLAGAARGMDAVRRYPWTIDGSGRENTIVIESLGTVAKKGAEGVTIMAAPSGHVVAVKVLDGSMRPASLVALELLLQAGALERAAVDGVEAHLGLDLAGGDAVVGRVRATV